MSDAYPFLILDQSCDEAAAWITRQVNLAGLQVLRTFDLQDARRDAPDCPCLRHGAGGCVCQMVVLLVYGEDHRPVSLVAHSHEGKTWLSIVDTPQQHADPSLERAIREALPPDSLLRRGQG